MWGCLHREGSDPESLFLLWHLSIFAILITTVPGISVWILLQKRKCCISKWWLDLVWVLGFLSLHFQYLFYLDFFPNILFLSVICPKNMACNLFCCCPQHNILLPFPLHDLGKYCHLYLNGKIWNWRSGYFFSSHVLSECLKWMDHL